MKTVLLLHADAQSHPIARRPEPAGVGVACLLILSEVFLFVVDSSNWSKSHAVG